MAVKTQLSLAEVREILKRHEAMSQIAYSLDPPVRTSSVSRVLSGQAASQRIFDACHTKAVALLKEEQRRAGSAA